MTITYGTSVAPLGFYAVSITDTSPTGVPYPDGSGNYAPQTRTFPVDTSFEPYRREAFRHRSIPAQRNAIQMTNIMGEGTVNTEGLWRREQREFQQGAGQQYLDHKDDDNAARFWSSKGVDVYNTPYQATLLPDVAKVVTNNDSNLMVTSVGDYMFVASGSAGTAKVYTNIGTAGNAPSTGVWGSGTAITWNNLYGGSAPSKIYGVTTANSYVYIATDTGIWFWAASNSAFAAYLYAGVDTSSNFTGYNMVAWANDQLIGASGNRLYAFQPRTAGSAPLFGSLPSYSTSTSTISYIQNNGTTTTAYLNGPTNNWSAGQAITISGVKTQSVIQQIVVSNGLATATMSTGQPVGMAAGDSVTVDFTMASSTATTNYNETVTLASVNDYASHNPQTVTWYTKKIPAGTYTTGAGNNFSGNLTSSTSLYNRNWNISNVTGNTITLQIPATTGSPSNPAWGTYGQYAINGSIGSAIVPDLLFAHPDANWVWSSAIGGETQVYIAGYSQNGTTRGHGCVYRSDLLGASTTSATGTQTTTTSTVAQPFQLVTPVQALPMSPDEYPTCIKSYLNFIFVGTNRGIRMAQTLSIYDPTATATGDLKSGPLIPNILTPLTYPVTAILGDGRFVWFSWNNYDSSITPNTYVSTGLGKLDLSNFISGDPLAPVYTSDLMVPYTSAPSMPTGYALPPYGNGIINSLTWNPILRLPVLAVGGVGIFEPYAINNNGVIEATRYVPTGNITTSIFDYGIPDQKAPVYFEYGGVTPTGTTLQANVICEPQESFKLTLPITSFVSPTTIGIATKEYPMPTVGGISNPKSSQFQVVMNLNASTITTTYDSSPTLYRWTLKSFPNVVSGTNISVVLQLASVAVVDGEEVYIDPYDNFYWLESLRQAQNLVVYTEGPLSASIAIVESLDWIPHKRRDNYENGFEGDCVITIKTLGPYSYTPTPTH